MEVNNFKAAYNYMLHQVKKIECKNLEMNIFYIDVTELSVTGDFTWMSETRKQKMYSYYNERDKKLLLGGELVFLYGIYYITRIQNERELQKYSDKLLRKTNRYGKPYLDEKENIKYNMSHSGKYVICTFSDTENGVDIEKINDANLDIAKRFFTAEEYNDILRASKQIRPEKFYEYWVMKESYIKAVGKGLSISLNSFSFNKISDGLWSVKSKNDQYDYIVEMIDSFDADYKIAVCQKMN